MAPCIYSLLLTPILRIGQLFIVTMVAQEVNSIGCFVCSSFNGSNPTCEDTFNSTLLREEPNTVGISNYQYPCWAFKKQRQGLFPADHCIKVNGHRTDDISQTMVIRTCALDSGTLTADTEIVRISHCGHFKYEGHQYSGCVQACDTDGCNGAFRMGSCWYVSYVIPVIVVLVAALRDYSLRDCMNASIDIVNRVVPILTCITCCAALLSLVLFINCVSVLVPSLLRVLVPVPVPVPTASAVIHVSWMPSIRGNCSLSLILR